MHNNATSLSIAMATYNGEEFLSQQIDSILNQSYQDFELIISDDASDDNTIEIAHSYAEKYPMIRVYKNSVRLGSVKNFERAIILCEGKYIALADQDDIWRKDRLAIGFAQLQRMEHSNKSTPLMVHSDLRMINSEGEAFQASYFAFKKYRLKKGRDLSHILGSCGVMGNTITMNSELKKLILPFPDNLPDHDYWIALINELYGHRTTINQPLVDYRLHKGNLSNPICSLKSTLPGKLRRVLSPDGKIPYMHKWKIGIQKELLKDSGLPKESITLLKEYLRYLSTSTNRLTKFYILIKYDIAKRNFWHRVGLFILILSKKAGHKI